MESKSRFREICDEMCALKEAKNYDYAHGGDELGNFIRVSHFFESYPNLRLTDPAVVCASYMMKQLDAILWSKNIGHELKVESMDDKYQDISIYSILMRMIDANKKYLEVDFVQEWKEPEYTPEERYALAHGTATEVAG